MYIVQYMIGNESYFIMPNEALPQVFMSLGFFG